MKILVGVPCMETLPVDFVNSILNLRSAGHEVTVHLEPLSLVYIARERIADIAIKGKYDYALFIDSDMVFTPDLLRKLLAADKDIVTGLAFMRKPPFSPCVYTRMRIGESGEREEAFLTDLDAGLIQVEACGLACCLIKTKVFETIKRHNSSIFWPLYSYGEDISFCFKARKEKFEIWADTSVIVGHLGSTIILRDDYEAWNEVKS